MKTTVEQIIRCEVPARRMLLAAYAVQEIERRTGMELKVPCLVRRGWTIPAALDLAELFDEQPAGFACAMFWRLAQLAETRTSHLLALARRLAQEPAERHEEIAHDYRLRSVTNAPFSLPDEYAAGWVAYRLGKGPGCGHLRAQGWLASREDFFEDAEDYVEFCKEGER
jgi:hypothetical protein